jgi:hypothetical protein
LRPILGLFAWKVNFVSCRIVFFFSFSMDKVRPPFWDPHHGSRVEEGELLLVSHRSVLFAICSRAMVDVL